MAVELDHFFVCTAPGGLEADRLLEIGLVEGSPNSHPGQGTANRRFFFQNAFLELLWVENPAEAQSDLVRPTGLWERCTRRGRGASPFGVALRPAPGANDTVPFPAWEYRPPYLPAPLTIHMASNSRVLTEPLLFYLPFGRRPDPDDPSRRQPREHRAGMRSITRLRLELQSGGPLSPELIASQGLCDGLSFVLGCQDLLEVEFDNVEKGRMIDLRPTLQLIFQW